MLHVVIVSKLVMFVQGESGAKHVNNCTRKRMTVLHLMHFANCRAFLRERHASVQVRRCGMNVTEHTWLFACPSTLLRSAQRFSFCGNGMSGRISVESLAPWGQCALASLTRRPYRTLEPQLVGVAALNASYSKSLAECEHVVYAWRQISLVDRVCFPTVMKGF